MYRCYHYWTCNSFQSPAMLRRFESVLSTVFTFSLILGTFPMKRYPGMTYRFSWKFYCYSILVGLIACVEGTYWMLDDLNHYSHSATIIIESIVFCFNIYTWVAVLVYYYLQREQLPDIVSRLYTTHNHIGITSYRRRYAACIVLMTLFNAIPSIFYVFNDALYLSDVLLVSIYFLFLNVSVIVACQYSALMSLLTDQLTFLTKQLSLLTFNIEIRQLIEHHHTLCALAARINKGFDIFLLQATTIPFVIAIINIYIAIVCLVKPDEFDDDSKLPISVMDALVNIGIIVLIVTAAKGAKDSAMDFNVQLWNNMLISKNLGKDNDLKMYVFMRYRIEQTACGFFKLDYTLLTSMTAGAVTYVVLLVQFTLLR